MPNKTQKDALAAKYKALALDLQKFFDTLDEVVYNSSECEPLTQAQSEFTTAYEELTGKSIS